MEFHNIIPLLENEVKAIEAKNGSAKRETKGRESELREKK